MADRLLAAERRDDLRRRVELDPETVSIEPGRRLAELLGALVARIPVRRGIAGGGGKRLDDRLGRRQVGIADAEADHIDSLALLLRDLPLELGEEVRRHGVQTFRESHSWNSSASSTVQISSAGPVSVARPSASST